ncbi:MAG TPA: nucleoside-diphosphate sugar epimerase/dehydratase [Planctomycetaceae bacterium]|jgi:FlaA1/EpsC-like NDP-sugar epimerase|nr:nucleoside-diphosphate sugar epimerase/dehydratase [Planctomycetaceae bacterium]
MTNRIRKTHFPSHVNGTNGHPPVDRCESQNDVKNTEPLELLTRGTQRFVRLVVQNTFIRVGLLGFGHLAVFLAAYWMAFCLRFDFAVPAASVAVFWGSVGFVLSLKICVFYASGHFHGWWRYVTFADLASLLRAAFVSLLCISTVNYFVLGSHIPRSVAIMDCVITIVLIGALRASWRLLREQFWPLFQQDDCRPALLVGTDDATGLLAHQIRTHPQSRYRIRGFLDVTGNRVGSSLGGIPVVGTLEDLPAVAVTRRITDILVIAGSLPGKRLRGLMDACDEAQLTLKIIPGPEDLFDGGRDVPIRSIDINDLLRREPVELDNEAIGQLLKGRTVMVTGAGGSIGSEICRQVLRFAPRTLVMVGRGENRIFAVDRELMAIGSSVKLVSCIGDVTDENRMRQILGQHRPDVIFHAAAHKHVPLMEANPAEAIKNNVGGTRCLADLADEFEVGCFVLISTDKAVNPANIMGATKRLAERYVLALAEHSSTRFIVTRFGNVLGSNGSVVPIFQDQIRRGGPITVTDPRMTRYFMTIPEASQLVLQAATMGMGGEIFVLDMGEPVRIVDLARDLIRLSGLPEHAIEIAYSGIRPGEKLYEELCTEEEGTLDTLHPKVRAAYHRPDSLSAVQSDFSELQSWVEDTDDVIRAKLEELLPEYTPGHRVTVKQPSADASIAS